MNLWQTVRVPFDAVRYGYREFRKALFTAPRPSGTYLAVDASVREIERHLGALSFAPNWEFSYHERGEVLNLARVVYDRTTVDGRTYVWWQTHVRGWDGAGGAVELHAHWELEPTEHPNEHLDGVGFGFDRGMDNLAEFLDEAGLEYAETEVTTDAEG